MRGALDPRSARALDFGFALGVRVFVGSVHLPPAGWTRDSFAWRSSLLNALKYYTEAATHYVQLFKLMLRVFVNLLSTFLDG